jgi:MIP family channel proteins
MPSLRSRLVAEAFGTFGLAFIGCAVVVVNGGFPNSGVGLIGIALAHALVLAVAITATMNISGGHINPAVTIGLLSVGRVTLSTAIAYIIAQLAGAVLGAFLVQALFPAEIVQQAMLGVPSLAGNLSVGNAIGIEIVLTFFLMAAVFGTAVSPTAPKVGGFGIGLVLVFDILVGGPLTGGVMNPSRAFGPALVGRHWDHQIVWWVGPIVGAVLAAQLWERVIMKTVDEGSGR